jgi:osmotically-inducible protein OsmY
MAIGAAGQYFLDPETGKRRRHMSKDRFGAFIRQRSDEASRKARYAAGAVKGAAHGAVPGTDGGAELNDPALARKVETEIFRPAESPKGDVDVNVEDGVVYLRGQLDRQEQIEDLVQAAGAVEGVKRVESLLHVPGEPAPSKAG